MSRMSTPTPLYSVTRPEDINALNNIITNLSLDNRARIYAVLTVPLIKPSSAYTVSATTTLDYAGYPHIIGMVKLGENQYAPLPYINATGAATLGVSEVISVSNVSNTDGTITITVKLDCNSTDHPNTLTRTVYLLVLKDKQ